MEAGSERGGQEGIGDSARYALRRTPSEGTGEGKGEAVFPRKRCRADRAWEHREMNLVHRQPQLQSFVVTEN